MKNKQHPWTAVFDKPLQQLEIMVKCEGLDFFVRIWCDSSMSNHVYQGPFVSVKPSFSGYGTIDEWKGTLKGLTKLERLLNRGTYFSFSQALASFAQVFGAKNYTGDFGEASNKALQFDLIIAKSREPKA